MTSTEAQQKWFKCSVRAQDRLRSLPARTVRLRRSILMSESQELNSRVKKSQNDSVTGVGASQRYCEIYSTM